MNSVQERHVVWLDFYSDGTTLSKSGTQSASFLKIRFSHILAISKRWYKIEIEQTPTTIPSNLPYEVRR